MPMEEPDMCEEQQIIVNLIANGRNVFYTGSAGCGKSTVLKAAVKRLKAMNKKVSILAPTGRAALQVDGMTTWSYMGWTPDNHKMPIDKLIQKGWQNKVKTRFEETDILIIDEISMVENHHLERISRALKGVLCYKVPTEEAPAFGGLQVVVTGDFCQLPPVKPFQHCIECGREMKLDDEDASNCPESHGPFPEDDKWAFRSKAWNEANFVHIHLKEIHRQSDAYFIRMLQKCRLGIPLSQGETRTLMTSRTIENPTKILCTRNEVSCINNAEFDRLNTPSHTFLAEDRFTWNGQNHQDLTKNAYRNLDGSLQVLADSQLEQCTRLRVGMLVILQVNLDLSKGLCNGSQGTICGFEEFDFQKLPISSKKAKYVDYLATSIIVGPHSRLRERQIHQFIRNQPERVWPIVQFHNGLRRTIYATCRVNSLGDSEPYSLLHRTQIPLIPGWAITAHKSQGMTLNRVIVNLSRAFAEGQVYVALSRATSLDGLMVEGDSRGLSAATGGDEAVKHFLVDKFGREIVLDFR
jgi:ATP-dependent DNA helicase PIF1